jgi:hypothetical protein
MEGTPMPRMNQARPKAKQLRFVIAFVFATLFTPSVFGQRNYTCTTETPTKPCLTVNGTSFWIVGEVRSFSFGGDSQSRIVSELHKKGWLECEGQSLDDVDFNDLYRAIGTTWGSRDPNQTYLIPDLRGMFLRGWGHVGSQKNPDGSPREPQFPGDLTGRVAPRTAQDVGNGGVQGNSGDAVGSVQQDEFQSHQHHIGPFSYAQVKAECGNGCGAMVNVGATDTSDPTSGRHGAETRPSNANVMYFIYVGQDVSSFDPTTGKNRLAKSVKQVRKPKP